MGKAAVDLPDPLEPGNASIESTDDLLAQLAGEEIDRLLSEAQIEKQSATPDSAIAPPPAPETENKLVEEKLPDVDQAMSSVSNDLQQLLSQPSSVPAAPETPAPPVAAVAAPAEIVKKEIPVAEAETGTTADERQALKAEEPVPVQHVPAKSVAEELNELDFDSEPRTPLYVKLLELINAPLAACPENVRDIMGKVAVITLLNAAGVLIYVFYFKGK